MPKYIVKQRKIITYFVEVEASSKDAAKDIVERVMTVKDIEDPNNSVIYTWDTIEDYDITEE